jgi:hypothetical protein
MNTVYMGNIFVLPYCAIHVICMQLIETEVVLHNSILISGLELHGYLYACNQTVACVQVCNKLYERFIYTYMLRNVII